MFLDRVVFCLFAEDVGLLPNQLFRRVVEGARGQPERLKAKLEELFSVMARGGDYGADSIMHFKERLKAKGPQTGELDPLMDQIAKEQAALGA